uniref:AB hydrolase-1 domain-containing protein n=1 Tax=Zosterops lateralis melanops TaxID=1220523 RepID=A0A8D2PF99_ZOSLA
KDFLTMAAACGSFRQSEIIRYHGFPSEEYEITTEDGYILDVFRIPAGRNSQNTGKKPAVLLHHGILGDCTHWIFNLPNNSLGFLLADVGYDVWLGNSRGVTWSLKHKTLKPCQKEFWQFSFDEIGKYDIPAELNFIMNKTGQKNVYYIGHSEGSAIGFIAFSTYPDLSQKIKAFIALAPVVTTTHATSPLVRLTQLQWLPVFILIYGDLVFESCRTEHKHSLASLTSSVMVSKAGNGVRKMNSKRVASTLMALLEAVQNSIHSGLLPVLQTAPPVYKIEEIKIPTAVWSGGQDTFADPKDMAKLLPRITNLIYHEHFPTWGHLDFLWGLDATEKMYLKIIELLKKYA